MAIFGNLDLEDVVQVDDKTRLDATRSFISKDEAAVTLVEIEPEGSAGYVDVTGSSSADWYLDWAYATDGAKTVSVRITTDGSPSTSTATLTVNSVVDDALFSDDRDLVALESNILKWVRAGRNSFLDYHRKAQTLILDHISEIGVRDSDQNKIVAADFIDVQEVRKWSENLTLRLIFQDLSNSSNDFFGLKSDYYMGREKEAMNKSVLALDLDSDGTLNDGEYVNFSTLDAVRK